LAGTKVEQVVGALERLRWTFRFKVDGLDVDGLTTRIGSSSLTLGGLLRHLGVQEDYAFHVKLAGENLPDDWADNGWDEDEDWDLAFTVDDDPALGYRRYDAALARSRAALAKAVARGGLDQTIHLTGAGGEAVSLRRLVLDLVEEYGRHTGHADLLREAVDGRVGEDPPAGWRPQT
jgi:hypothetical protein